MSGTTVPTYAWVFHGTRDHNVAHLVLDDLLPGRTQALCGQRPQGGGLWRDGDYSRYVAVQRRRHCQRCTEILHTLTSTTE